MATKLYIARVELHHDDSYDRLHELLYNISYYRTIFLRSGHWYDLPHATYACLIDSTAELQLEVIKNTIRVGLGLRSSNEVTRSERSFSLTVSESGVGEDELYNARFILRLADGLSALPPGASLV